MVFVGSKLLVALIKIDANGLCRLVVELETLYFHWLLHTQMFLFMPVISHHVLLIWLRFDFFFLSLSASLFALRSDRCFLSSHATCWTAGLGNFFYFFWRGVWGREDQVLGKNWMSVPNYKYMIPKPTFASFLSSIIKPC